MKGKFVLDLKATGYYFLEKRDVGMRRKASETATYQPSIKFAGTHLYTWVARGTVRVSVFPD